MDTFDVIVIGAGNAGLVAGLELQKKGKKVLILEKENQVGGLSTSFVRGRFEFDANPFPLNGFGNLNQKGPLYELFDKLGILNKLSFSYDQELFSLITYDTKEEYTFPSTMEAFIDKMEEYVPSSKEPLITFFGLCEDILEALEFLNEKEEINLDELIARNPNFVQLASCKAIKVLEEIHMPKKAIDILSTYCLNIGSPLTELNFVTFALAVNSYIHYPIPKVKNTSYAISSVLKEEFINAGGKILLETPVEEILIENGKVSGVKTAKEEYRTKKVIAGISPYQVYGNLILKEKVPTEALQLQNSRMFGPKVVIVYVGLNKTKEELGFTHSHYYVRKTLQIDKEYTEMNQNLVTTLMVSLEDNINDQTSLMTLVSLSYQDIFKSILKEDTYYDLKEKLAKEIIEYFEQATNVPLKEAIEEIEVATPVTLARYTNHPDGNIYGFMAKGYDNFVPRWLNRQNENFIEGLYFCGCYGSFSSSNAATYEDGYEVAKKVMEG